MDSYDEYVFTKESDYSENFISNVFHSLFPLPTVKIVSRSDALVFFLSLLILFAYNEHSSYTVSTELFVNEIPILGLKEDLISFVLNQFEHLTNKETISFRMRSSFIQNDSQTWVEAYISKDKMTIVSTKKNNLVLQPTC